VLTTDIIDKVLTYDFKTVLDIGAGYDHAEIFRSHGKIVTTNNLYDADYVGDYLNLDLEPFDCIWASYVLEHQVNPGLFLQKCFRDLKEGGLLAVAVPPLKSEIVGGHVTLWNAGILLYQLVLAGFDCSQALVKTSGYNICAIVRKKSFTMPKLKNDFGDIKTLNRYFPFDAEHGFNGDIGEINW